MQNPKSADDQNAGNRKCAEHHDWIVSGEFKDEAQSGRSTRKRKGYYDLMAAVEAGHGQVVIVEDLSRLGRDATELQIMARKLEEADVVLCTTFGEVLAGMHLALLAQMAEQHSIELAYRVSRGHRSAAARGRPIGGVAYGYQLRSTPGENGELREKDETKAEIVRRIFRDYDAGVSSHAICAALNTEGVPPPQGQLWRSRTLTGNPGMQSGLLRNPIYIGQVVYGRSRSKLIKSTGKVKVTAAPAEERVHREVPGLRIISQDIWDRVQARLANSSVAAPNRARHPTYLLSGLCICGVCGRPVAVVGAAMGCTGRRYGAGCSNRRKVVREVLEEAVLSGLKQRLFKPALLDLYLEEYRAELSKATAEFNARQKGLESRKRDLDQRVNNLVIAIETAAAGEALEVLTAKLKRLERDRRQLNAEIEAKPGRPPESLETDTIIGRLEVFLENLRSAMAAKERDAARAREIFRSFIDRIVMTPVHDGRDDPRGFGPVRITVDGSITKLLGQSAYDRILQGSGTNSATLGLPIVGFSYSVDIPWKNPRLLPGIETDLPLLRGMLDAAETPISQTAIVDAFAAAGAERPDLKAERVVRYLRTADEIRPVRFGVGYCGWVANGREITNDEWRARVARQNAAVRSCSVKKADRDATLLEGDLVESVGAAGSLDEAIGKDLVIAAEDHRVGRRGRIKPDRAERYPRSAKLPAARRAAAGRQE